MTQNKEATLLDSIQSEVSREASPMLDFLVRHARKIFVALLALITVIVVFGVWSYLNAGKQREAEEALGRILILPDDPAKLEALTGFAGGAAPELKTAALLALAQSATLQQQPEIAAGAWAQISQLADPATRLVAEVGQAGALSAQGKNAEALSLLESLLPTVPAEAVPVLNAYIVSVAEQLGDWDRAIAACEAIIGQSPNPDAQSVWEQRRAYFISKK